MTRPQNRWMLALSAQALRESACFREVYPWSHECRFREELPRTRWCRRCRTLARLERMGFLQPERPSDREFNEALARGELVFVEPEAKS